MEKYQLNRTSLVLIPTLFLKVFSGDQDHQPMAMCLAREFQMLIVK